MGISGRGSRTDVLSHNADGEERLGIGTSGGRQAHHSQRWVAVQRVQVLLDHVAGSSKFGSQL